MSIENIINTYDQLNRAVKDGVISPNQAVAISYSPYEARSGRCSGSQVWSPFFKTNPEGAAWYEYGKKSFHGNRASSMPAAMLWATEKYGIVNWKGNRMRDVVPAIVQQLYPLPKL